MENIDNIRVVIAMAEEDNTSMTEVKTMWSETLLEALYVAFEKGKNDATIRGILKDLQEKGYEKDYLVEKVEKKVSPAAAGRLKLIFAGKSSGGTSSPTAKKQSAKEGGVVGKLKGLFK